MNKKSHPVIQIKLSQAAVLTEVREKNKITEILANHSGQLFNQDKIDKYGVSLYLPIGVSFMLDGGNHTFYSGKIKGIGTVEFGNGRNKIYDMSELYDYIYFDGIYYRRKNDDSIIGRAVNFEFGCIFEIGRKISENKLFFSYGMQWDK